MQTDGIKKLDQILENHLSFEEYIYSSKTSQDIDDYFFLFRSLYNDFMSILNIIHKVRKLIENHNAFIEKVLLNDIFEKDQLMIQNIMNCERANLFVYDKIRKELWCRLSKESNVITKIELGKGICGWVAQNKVNLIIDDVYFDVRFDKDIDDIKLNQRTQSILCVPVFDELTGELIGVIEAVNKKKNRFFDHTDERVMEIMAKMISTQLIQCMEYSDYITHEFKLKKILNNVHRFYSNNNIDKIMQIGVQLLRSMLTTEKIICFYYHFEKDKIFKLGDDFKVKMSDISKGIIACSVKRRQMVYTFKPSSDPNFNPIYDIDTYMPLVTIPIFDEKENKCLAIIQLEYNINREIKHKEEASFISPLDNDIIEIFVTNFKNALINIKNNKMGSETIESNNNYEYAGEIKLN